MITGREFWSVKMNFLPMRWEIKAKSLEYANLGLIWNVF